ncbi:chaperone NapD [Luteimonas sp. SJ-92]|uniref:Chaperone NapD n=1 Tax=Luteimonas salinisoli TaxID=2752307 RepID=A0A853J9W7_9GAMM|nr:chaperone NapD [Luteimonas salinisoli]NZA25544.1 chaperone NapD [Luteimonas salinisoli]
MSARRDELHIASLVVQHRAEARAGLHAAAAGIGGLEIAIPGDHRSVLLQESPDTAGLMDCIDRLRALPGVLNVSLVYHHAEARALLDQPASTDNPGAPHGHAS